MGQTFDHGAVRVEHGYMEVDTERGDVNEERLMLLDLKLCAIPSPEFEGKQRLCVKYPHRPSTPHGWESGLEMEW